MNKINLVGNLVDDCDLQYVGKGKDKVAKARFTMACNERLGKDKEKVNFIPCVLWGGMAEGLADYLTKGSKVAIFGRLDVDNVKDEDSETWKTYVNVNVSDLDFCSTKKDDSKDNKSNKTEKNRRK